jgi:hypothetical protein
MGLIRSKERLRERFSWRVAINGTSGVGFGSLMRESFQAKQILAFHTIQQKDVSVTHVTFSQSVVSN